MIKIASGTQYIILNVLVFRRILAQIILHTEAIDQHFFLSILKEVGYLFILQEACEILIESVVSTRQCPKYLEGTQIFNFSK